VARGSASLEEAPSWQMQQDQICISGALAVIIVRTTKGVRGIWSGIWTWPTRPRIIWVHWRARYILAGAFILLDGRLLIFFGFLRGPALSSTCLRLLLSHTVHTCAWINVVIDRPIGTFAPICQWARNLLETWIKG
jgi:hypothetical protein